MNKTIQYLILIAVICLIAFIGLSKAILQQNFIVSIDQQIFNYFDQHHTKATASAMKAIGDLGSKKFVIGATILTGLVLIWFKYWRQAIMLGVAIASAITSGDFIKNIIARPQPDLTGVSFPSTHAFLSIILYGLIIYFLIKLLDDKELKLAGILLFTTTIIAIGITRIYLRTHWLSDVYGGYLLGGVWLLASIIIVEVIAPTRKQNTHRK